MSETKHSALTADHVNAVAGRCLFTDDELRGVDGAPEGAVIVQGIIGRYGFHPDRLRRATPEIAEMLAELPDEFMSAKGGGMSFLNACMTRDGDHWGEHPTMGMLFALGIGAGLASYPLPREVWPALPGGVPYITIDSAAITRATGAA